MMVIGADESVMAGHGYYGRHSRPQRAAATVAHPWLAAAAAAVPLPPVPAVIADMGCAGGANEMEPMALAIDTLRARDPAVAVEVVHTDLPGNDFAPLFELLAGPAGYPAGRGAVYPSVVGRSLYGPLVPDQRLHLGWSAITLHWLSTMPVTVPGHVYANLVPEGPARAALREQAADDWRAFLRERARELVDGGELVLVAGTSMPDGRSGAEGLFEMIDEQLAVMVDAGVLRPAESDAIFYPVWNRTADEWRAPLTADSAAGSAFDLLDSAVSATDDAETYSGYADAAQLADAYLPFVRAVTERPFFRWLDADRTPAQRAAVVEAFYAGLRDRIAADPAAALCRWHVMALRLRRRPR
jgi:hypothetical protein